MGERTTPFNTNRAWANTHILMLRSGVAFASCKLRTVEQGARRVCQRAGRLRTAANARERREQR